MGDPAAPGVDIVVFLGTSWRELAGHNTRWRAVTTAWADDPRVASVRVVDFPTFGRRALRRLPSLACRADSWHARIGVVDAVVPLPATPTPLDAVGWRLTGRALRRVLAPGPRSIGIAASPLWSPVLPHVGFDRIGFDAVDDMRAHPRLAAVRGRVLQGYRAATGFDFASAVSRELADRLRAEEGLAAEVVQNGVDLALYAGGAAEPLPDEFAGQLPDAPFAVYVGRLNTKIDFALLEATAAQVPVVLAGPVVAEVEAQVRALPAVWLGPVPHTQVPALLQRSAVGLVPFVVNDLTRSMDSMKVLEYLAAGLSVVSSALPGMAELSPRVHVAAGAPAFAAATTRLAAAGRAATPDPAVARRGWSETARRLLDLATGEAD